MIPIEVNKSTYTSVDFAWTASWSLFKPPFTFTTFQDALRIVQLRHRDVIHVGDVEDLSGDKIEELGPFDLVMGGSPCNDLSGNKI